ncbi:bacterial transcriptional activator domain-containing protein [Amycolatopsis pithecellobii]|uniref:Bacterial transcriptional activator domain-containing protein n=1 Tax=Amycolatopsis pithecellobii TaxID=664692 RepID=A0A6N7Z269_9PSEU|nr:bacterial transcriptional activator domain-containing protein [Amycolatopsis pithecellobii]MTD53824.1 hypothetical protein [Amycolatopsis pithecellobii]
MPNRSMLLKAKTRVPPVRSTAVPRAWISEAIHAHLAAAEILWVTATAGSGKTTSVVHALAEHHDPVAWLRLDDSDATPGRLLLCLEQTLSNVVSSLEPMVESAPESKLLKTVELLSYLAVEGPVVNRPSLMAALFDSKNDKSANAYLRMAVNGARRLVNDHEVILSDAMNRVSGRAVLPTARSPWVTAYRQRWNELILDIRHIAAEAAYDTAQYDLAYQLTQQVLAEAPYRERAWRLAMHISSAVGDTDRIIAAYRACETALREVPTQPSAATRELLDRLRR